MKRPIFNLILTIILAIILSLFFPWWSIILAAFFTGLTFPLRGYRVFLFPFLAIFFYWIVYAFILASINDFTLSKKIGVLFGIGDNWILVLLITGLIGGLAAGISAIFGKQLSLIFVKKNP